MQGGSVGQRSFEPQGDFPESRKIPQEARNFLKRFVAAFFTSSTRGLVFGRGDWQRVALKKVT